MRDRITLIQIGLESDRLIEMQRGDDSMRSTESNDRSFAQKALAKYVRTKRVDGHIDRADEGVVALFIPNS